MIWPPPVEQGATAFVGAPSTADNSSTGTRGWYATEAAMEIFVSACEVALTRKKSEHDHGTAHGHAAEAADMLKVACSGGCTLITAGSGSRSRLAARSPYQSPRRHAAAQSAALEGVDARTQPSGGLAPLGRWRRQAMCSRHHPLSTTADAAAFLIYESTAAKQLLQIAAAPRGRAGTHLRAVGERKGDDHGAAVKRGGGG
jgi:hypothetical protein